jgi:hypothetical protein
MTPPARRPRRREGGREEFVDSILHRFLILVVTLNLLDSNRPDANGWMTLQRTRKAYRLLGPTNKPMTDTPAIVPLALAAAVLMMAAHLADTTLVKMS